MGPWSSAAVGVCGAVKLWFPCVLCVRSASACQSVSGPWNHSFPLPQAGGLVIRSSVGLCATDQILRWQGRFWLLYMNHTLVYHWFHEPLACVPFKCSLFLYDIDKSAPQVSVALIRSSTLVRCSVWPYAALRCSIGKCRCKVLRRPACNWFGAL